MIVPVRKPYSSGNVLIAVTLIGTFIMLIAGTIVNNLLVSEAEAVEESLAKSRVYWAARGHMDYALSRIQDVGVCTPSGDCLSDDGADFPEDQQPDDGTIALSSPLDNRADSLRTYLRELYGGEGPNQEARHWNYDEYDQASDTDRYRLSMQHTIKVAEGGSTADGYLRVTIGLTDVGSFERLQGLNNRIRPLQYDVCIGAPTGTSVTDCNLNGPQSSTVLPSSATATNRRLSFIFRMRRPPIQ